MGFSALQVILVFIVTFIVAIDQFDFLESLYQPIVTGAVIGAILGDLQTGLVVGGTYQLMTIGNMPVGGAQPPNAVIGGIIRTACGGNPQMVKILLDTIGESADIRLKERDVKLREKAAVLANGGSNKPKEQSTMVQLVQTLQKAREKRRTP